MIRVNITDKTGRQSYIDFEAQTDADSYIAWCTSSRHWGNNAISAQSAFYSGSIEKIQTSVTITANTAGSAGNVTLTFDGKSDLDTLIADWNTSNPNNQLTLTGDGTQVPSSGSISLYGGFDAKTQEYTITQTDITNDQTLNPDWIKLRAQRDQLLSDCDWTQLADIPTTINKSAWATYRQALRDLPANTTDPNNPTWPLEPT